jgi:hypothetical protein
MSSSDGAAHLLMSPFKCRERLALRLIVVLNETLLKVMGDDVMQEQACVQAKNRR